MTTIPVITGIISQIAFVIFLFSMEELYVNVQLPAEKNKELFY